MTAWWCLGVPILTAIAVCLAWWFFIRSAFLPDWAEAEYQRLGGEGRP